MAMFLFFVSVTSVPMALIAAAVSGAAYGAIWTLIPTLAGPVVRMDQVARLERTEGPSTIQREWSRRRTTTGACR